MPLHRRLPKRGFTNIFKKEYSEVNLRQLTDFPADSVVDPQALLDRRVIRDLRDGIKILGNGELQQALTIRAHKFSKSAVEKIQKAGGTAEVIN
jgi:large subunit ribosomal protein L15